MICLTGADKTFEEIRKRSRQNSGYDLFEIRLDILDSYDLPSDPPVEPDRLIITCRPKRQKGFFTGSEEERTTLLERASRLFKPAWMDVELDTPEPFRTNLVYTARQTGAKILSSTHVFESPRPGTISQVFKSLVESNGDAIKLAVHIHDAAQLGCILDLDSRGKPSVFIAMSSAGLISRALYDRFGSAWTYVAPGPGKMTAEGQMDMATFLDYRLPARGYGLYVLMGGSQVMNSPGPYTYNHVFKETNTSAVYLPVVTKDPGRTIPLLQRLGLKGASITMPLKKECAKLADNLTPEAEWAGAVNTITIDESGGTLGHLTDGLGAKSAINRARRIDKGTTCVIMGTGGTAAAIATTLLRAGAQVTVLGRSRQKARTLARRIGCNHGALQDLGRFDFQVLVNATPVGSNDPGETLVADKSLLSGKVVLDVSLRTNTRLLQDTQEAGGVPVSGVRMWAEQGKLQLEAWNLPSVSPGKLHTLACASLNRNAGEAG